MMVDVGVCGSIAARASARKGAIGGKRWKSRGIWEGIEGNARIGGAPPAPTSARPRAAIGAPPPRHIAATGKRYGRFHGKLARRHRWDREKRQRKAKLRACLEKKGLRRLPSLTNQRLARHVRQEINRAVNLFCKDHANYQVAYEALNARGCASTRSGSTLRNAARCVIIHRETTAPRSKRFGAKGVGSGATPMRMRRSTFRRAFMITKSSGVAKRKRSKPSWTNGIELCSTGARSASARRETRPLGMVNPA